MKRPKILFDSDFTEKEQLPRKFTVNFDSVEVGSKMKIRVSLDEVQVGDFIDDNSKVNDFYRFHDIFHYTFAAFLGWSPCTRAMLKRKRKSNPSIDEVEDGARATITEEAISLIIFNEAKKKNFFKDQTKVSTAILNQIKEMTSTFEVCVRSKKDWENAILNGYSLFHDLAKNNGGKIHFDMLQKSAVYEN
jgi:hypothetical protein